MQRGVPGTTDPHPWPSEAPSCDAAHVGDCSAHMEQVASLACASCHSCAQVVDPDDVAAGPILQLEHEVRSAVKADGTKYKSCPLTVL